MPKDFTSYLNGEFNNSFQQEFGAEKRNYFLDATAPQATKGSFIPVVMMPRTVQELRQVVDELSRKPSSVEILVQDKGLQLPPVSAEKTNHKRLGLFGLFGKSAKAVKAEQKLTPDEPENRTRISPDTKQNK